MREKDKSLASVMTSQLPEGRKLKKCVSYSVRLGAYWQAKLNPDHALKGDVSIPEVSRTDSAAQIPTWVQQKVRTGLPGIRQGVGDYYT